MLKLWQILTVCGTLVFACPSIGQAEGSFSTSNPVRETVPASIFMMMQNERRALFASAGRLDAIASPYNRSRNASDTRVFSVAELDRLPRARGSREWRCLTEALYFEARGESIQGQYAVAEVILNRVNMPSYPNSICAVVNQGTGRLHACQFSYTCDGIPERISEPKSWERLGKIAKIMMNGAPRDLTDQASHYHTTAVRPRWSRVYQRTAHIGDHLFYRRTD